MALLLHEAVGLRAERFQSGDFFEQLLQIEISVLQQLQQLTEIRLDALHQLLRIVPLLGAKHGLGIIHLLANALLGDELEADRDQTRVAMRIILGQDAHERLHALRQLAELGLRQLLLRSRVPLLTLHLRLEWRGMDEEKRG